jgi:phytoene/squalene synthetase
MDIHSAKLAKQITWDSSKQTYFTIAMMVDRDLIDDAYRAYGYFRWVDDLIDIYSTDKSVQEAFIDRQRSLVRSAFATESVPEIQPEERILINLIQHDRGENSLLRSYISGMMDLMAYDAGRKGMLISEDELHQYSSLLASSVMDALQYFIGNRCQYPMTQDRTHAVMGAHITHMLRDMVEDLELGYINIPLEILDRAGINTGDLSHPAYRDWVKRRVELARSLFKMGTVYIDGLTNLRCRIVGQWYCARFECVLDAIERDQYRLRPSYNELKGPSRWFEVARLTALVPMLHLIDGVRLRRHPQSL